MREPLYDRCLTLEIQRDPWLNGIGTNQCNHAGVWGKRGQRGHNLSACSLELLARLEHQVCFCFCMEWQTADWPHECYIALRFPQMPHKKSPGRSASQTWPRWMWWIPLLACQRGCSTTGFMYSIKPLKSPLSFFVKPNVSCRAYLKIYSLCMSHLKTPSSSLSLSSCTHSAQLLLPFLATLLLHLSELPACEWFLKWSICLWIPIYQLVSAYIDRMGIGSYMVQWGVIPFMGAHSTPGLNHSGNSGCRLKTYCNLHALLYSNQLN